MSEVRPPEIQIAGELSTSLSRELGELQKHGSFGAVNWQRFLVLIAVIKEDYKAIVAGKNGGTLVITECHPKPLGRAATDARRGRRRADSN